MSAPAPQPAQPDPAPPPAEPEERRYPSTFGGLLYLGVLGAAAVGIGVAWAGDWRLGVRLLSAALIFAAAARLAVPHPQAGMLRVRHRLVDVGLLAGVGVVLLLLVSSIPA